MSAQEREYFNVKPIVRCSSLDQILSCNGALTLLPLVDPRTGEEGDEGTALHQIAHFRMVTELGAVGFPGNAVECKATKFSEWIANYYFRHVQDTAPCDWSLEVEAAIEHEFEHFILSGHIDSVAMSADATNAIGFDLKTGYAAVDIAEENNQVLGYACLLHLAYPSLQKITFYIVQPRADEEQGEQRVSSVEIDNIPQAVAFLEKQLNAAIENNRELNTGRRQCKWCSAALQCPALIKERELMKHTLQDNELAVFGRQPDDATLADWVLAGKTLNRALDDAEKIAKRRIEDAGSLVASDGSVITVKKSAGSYEVPDRPAFLSAFRAVLPSDDSLAKCYKPSMSAIKDEIAEVMSVKKTSKKDAITAETIFDGHFRALTKQGERVTLVVN